MRGPMYLNFLFLIIVSIATVVASYLFGNEGLEVFYATIITLSLFSGWITIQLIKKLYRLSEPLILKILVTPLPIMILLGGWFLAIGTFATEDESVNWWVVLLGVIPSLFPRIGMYKRINRPNRLSIGILITTFSIILLYIAFNSFQPGVSDGKSIVLVLAVQTQLLLTYLTVQTNYLERFRASVLKVCERLGIRSYKNQALVVICTVGLPYIVCVYLIYYLAL